MPNLEDKLSVGLRASGVLLMVSLSLVALAFAWSLTTRSTLVTSVNWPIVHRENLLTGRSVFCVAGQNGAAGYCSALPPPGDWSHLGVVVRKAGAPNAEFDSGRPYTRPEPRFSGTPVDD